MIVGLQTMLRFHLDSDEAEEGGGTSTERDLWGGGVNKQKRSKI